MNLQSFSQVFLYICGMDIDLLAKMVKEVMMNHDGVTLPGLGSFAAELVPATFSDKGYTINPPYRRLYFIPRQGDDTLLADLYASSNNISIQDATRIIVEFTSEMKNVLIAKKIVVFPGLGRLRATRENHFFFVADEDLDIYPAGFGLEPISLKTHEETPEEVREAVSSLAEMLEKEPEPVPDDIPEEVPVIQAPVPEETQEPQEEPKPAEVTEEETKPEEESKPEVETKPEKGTTLVEEPKPTEEPKPAEEPTPAEEPAPVKHRPARIWRILLWVLVALLILAVVFALVGRLAPNWLDYYLYTPEELEILHNL